LAARHGNDKQGQNAPCHCRSALSRLQNHSDTVINRSKVCNQQKYPSVSIFLTIRTEVKSADKTLTIRRPPPKISIFSIENWLAFNDRRKGRCSTGGC
jgi:hypothetical protein